MAETSLLPQHQIAPRDAASVSVRIGKSVELDARMTSAGLLSVGALVSGILLSTAVIVLAARRNGKAQKQP